MQPLDTPAADLIQQRFSCRDYADRPIPEAKRQPLQAFIDALPPGPFGSQPRFGLFTAPEDERTSLRGLGTYGFIKGASGFIIGAMHPGGKALEDFGCLMERIILYATALDLGTCWLGGTFTKSSFSKKINLSRDEQMPAVTAIGEIADAEKSRKNPVRRYARGDRRLPWEGLFYAGEFGRPLDPAKAGAYAAPLEMVRLAPSASNKQPWRIIQDRDGWHFYLQRTPGYRQGFFQVLLDLVDLQRVDLGIALCHFELTARELGLGGAWAIREPDIQKPDGLTEYTASWIVR